MPDQAKIANQIFISYRRDDSAAITGRIYDRLIQKFGRQAIFKDVDSIPLGINYRKYLDSIVSECAVILVVIGDKWMESSGEAGKCRLDDPRDFVRIEIESALRRDIPVIPLLVQDASLPTEESLAESLQELAYRNGLTIGHDPHFHGDISRLIADLETILMPAPRIEQFPQGVTSDALPGAETEPPPGDQDLHQEGTPAAVAPDTSIDEINKDESRVTWKTRAGTFLRKTRVANLLRKIRIEAFLQNTYVRAFLLGAILPGVFAFAGALAGDRYNGSQIIVGEMSAAYALVIAGFRVGRKRPGIGWRVSLLISAVPFLINLGLSFSVLYKYDDEAKLLSITAVFMLPMMPLLAYLGLHLGSLYSSREAARKKPV
jgi:hypothetical protein